MTLNTAVMISPPQLYPFHSLNSKMKRDMLLTCAYYSCCGPAPALVPPVNNLLRQKQTDPTLETDAILTVTVFSITLRNNARQIR